jgi:(2S)-methylsuccinyl-CoA dehydrogenase
MDKTALKQRPQPAFGEAVAATEQLYRKARQNLQAVAGDDLSGTSRQHERHGLAWLATYLEVLRQLDAHALRLEAQGRLGELEQALVGLLFGEYLGQISGGIAMSQSEIIRPHDLGLDTRDIGLFRTPAVDDLIAGANSELKRFVVEAALDTRETSCLGALGLDETTQAMREQIARFADQEIAPHAHDWHLKNELIPDDTLNALAELGIFGLTIPESYDGLGLGKTAMCVVSEELSRGFLGVGSLGTRTEIAAELILTGGTDEQKSRWLPLLASGATLPTAVFTEPNTGSDLARLATRATKQGSSYAVTGAKTWITHGARSDLMTLLARTGSADDGYKGLSMFLAEKPRGSGSDPFPAAGMSGSEIEVIGYRGMKEYEISFDGFEVSDAALLGGVEGEGFKQLMQTFESARIQTAARGIGVAQAAFDLGLGYAAERKQFGREIVHYPRIANKLALAAAEIYGLRQLTYYAARRKDDGARCDLEAGMAKLLSARIAWSAADGAVQIHGGNGFSLEFPVSRVLCDARILGIFEGASEIQAQVIARRLMETTN